MDDSPSACRHIVAVRNWTAGDPGSRPARMRQASRITVVDPRHFQPASAPGGHWRAGYLLLASVVIASHKRVKFQSALANCRIS